MKIRLIWPGKTRAVYFREAIAEYVSRISKLVDIEVVEIREQHRTDKRKDERIKRETEDLLRKSKASWVITLDPNGKMWSSEDLARWFGHLTGDVDFLVGGPHGIAAQNSMKFSLGKITLPHELARVVLVEQIYRALTILRNLPYHK